MYETPEMEAVKFKCNKMLMASDGSGSTSDPNNPIDAVDGDY